MTKFKKNKLKDAMDAVREVFYDSIECRIRYSGRSYAAIASELGCSEQLVYQVAKLRRLGRNAGNVEADGEVDESAVGGQ